MRMWNVDPKLLCNKHLLGEHVEMHMFEGCIRKGKSLKGYIEKGLVEIHNIGLRHFYLSMEMKRRGMKHKSCITPLLPKDKIGNVDVELSKKTLLERCEECRKRTEER